MLDCPKTWCFTAILVIVEGTLKEAAESRVRKNETHEVRCPKTDRALLLKQSDCYQGSPVNNHHPVSSQRMAFHSKGLMSWDAWPGISRVF